MDLVPNLKTNPMEPLHLPKTPPRDKLPLLPMNLNPMVLNPKTPLVASSNSSRWFSTMPKIDQPQVMVQPQETVQPLLTDLPPKTDLPPVMALRALLLPKEMVKEKDLDSQRNST